MVTYNDLLEVGENEDDRIDFVYKAINQHKSSDLYKDAVVAEQYFKKQNKTILDYQKLLYTLEGKAIVDEWSSNFKIVSGYFNRFVTQEVQYLLGNGVTWADESTSEKLGNDFDYKLQEAAGAALVGAVSFGFFNLDHMDVFKIDEYVPLYDENNGALMSGIRFWQIDSSKPLRATLYEIDGYTNYIWNKRDGKTSGEVLSEKKPYKQKVRFTEADGEEIYDGENYPTFPIIPLWGNKHKQSELVGLREQIDCYDLIKSGIANTVDETSIIYWLVQNAEGMDDVDIAQTLEKIKILHAASVGEGQTIEPHTVDLPVSSSLELLQVLRADLYEDAMCVDIKEMNSGADTATHIKAAYEPLDEKCSEFEWCIKKFLNDILKTAEIDDTPTFTRKKIVNQGEEVTTILQAATFLPRDYIVSKLVDLLGDSDRLDEVLKMLDEEDMNRFMGQNEEDDEPENDLDNGVDE